MFKSKKKKVTHEEKKYIKIVEAESSGHEIQYIVGPYTRDQWVQKGLHSGEAVEFSNRSRKFYVFDTSTMIEVHPSVLMLELVIQNNK